MGNAVAQRRSFRSDAAIASERPDPVRLMQQALAALLIVAATFSAYSGAIRGGFIWDDDKYVTENPVITAPDGLGRIWTSVGEKRETSQFYPLVYTTFWIEYRLYGGFNAGGFHVVNVMLHALNALLVVCLLKYLKVPGAWIAGAIFALHPVHVESAAWITERKNVLSGFLYLLSMLAYLRFEDRRRWGWYAGALLCFCLALLSKSVTCTLPAALILIRWFRGKPITLSYVAGLVPFFAAGMATGLHTAWYEVRHVGARGDEYALSMGQRLLLAGRALWFYPAKLTWPANLTFIYPRWTLNTASLWQWLYPLGAVAVAAVAWVFRSRWGRGPVVALAFMAGTLFPALGFFDVFPFRYSFVADHFQYLASLGWIALVVALAAHVVQRTVHPDSWRRVVAGFLCGGVLLVLGVKTYQQGRMYESQVTLWEETIRRNPNAAIAYNNLGIRLRDLNRLPEAEQCLRQALRLKPDDPAAMTNLGGTLQAQGKTAESEQWYRKAIETDPKFPHLHFNLGTFLQNAGRHAEAAEAFRQEIDVNPVHAGAYANLGVSLGHLGQFPEAERNLRKAIEMLPNYPDAQFNLGMFLAIQERFSESIPYFRKAVELDPRNPKFREKLQAAQQASRKQRAKR